LGALGLWGIVDACMDGPMQALFADSIPTGERSKWYSYLQIAWLAPGALGPSLAIVLFLTLGNDWTFAQLEWIFMLGIIMHVVPIYLIFQLNNGQSDLEVHLLNGGSDQKEKEEKEEKKMEELKPWGCITQAKLPYIMFASDLVMALGSGMTVQFVSLFFKDDLHMSPAGVQGVWVVLMFAIAGTGVIGQKISKKLGRITTSIMLNLIGIISMTVVALMFWYVTDKWYFVIPVYLIRAIALNTSYTLLESVLMDYVPKETRARWKSLDSFRSTTWAGSAVIGGWLANQYDYSFTFIVTSFVHLLGTMILALLWPIVPMEVSEEITFNV